MQMPNAENAYVEERKITHYLLSFDSEEGKSKAAFFTRFGFAKADWQLFASALCQHAMSHAVTQVEQNQYATKYVLEGPLQTPDGRNPMVRTVWAVVGVYSTPRLVTAYPLD